MARATSILSLKKMLVSTSVAVSVSRHRHTEGVGPKIACGLATTEACCRSFSVCPERLCAGWYLGFRRSKETGPVLGKLEVYGKDNIEKNRNIKKKSQELSKKSGCGISEGIINEVTLESSVRGRQLDRAKRAWRHESRWVCKTGVQRVRILCSRTELNKSTFV